MAISSQVPVPVREQDLIQYCATMLEHAKVPADEAMIVARNLVAADARGVESHGVVRFPNYFERLLAGGTNPRPNIRPIRETRTTAVLDGDNGLGHLVGVRAMELAIEKASEGDCAFVSVKNSNHYGTAAYYTEMATRRDMVGISFTIGAINHMTPWGGAEAILGNNPFSFAMPTGGEFPVVLDMACSNAARGKIIVAAKDGTPIPANWATDANGNPTTDPIEALKGFVQPIAGPKGYSLTLMVGLMSTMLSGAAFGSEVGHMYENTNDAQDVGHLFGVLPIAAFEDVSVYRERMAKMARDVTGVKKAKGVERIYLPGEREHIAAQLAAREGIPLNHVVFQELVDLGAKYGTPLARIA